MRSVSIIGVGRVGGALALALSRAGYRVEILVHRSRDTAAAVAGLIRPAPVLLNLENQIKLRSEVIFMTVPDPEISAVAHNFADLLDGVSTVFHTSGSLSSEVLAPLRAEGRAVGSIHPLVSISDPIRGSDEFADCYFCVEGDEAAVNTADSIVTTLGGTLFSIPTSEKPMYHAAAVTACGHLVALIDIAAEMLSECGMEPERAKKVLMPLVSSTVENLAIQSPEDALTGTFARADKGALNRHLSALRGRVSDEVLRIYLDLGARSLDLATRRGVDPDAIGEMRKRISIAKRNGG